MLNLVRRALRGAAVCAAASALVLGGATPALAKDALSLPVEFNDFNADNVLFEYSISGGLESGLENLGTGAGSGLVEPTLGANGNPVYTRAAVEGAARAMAAELNGAWEPTAPAGGTAALYKALQADYRSDAAADKMLVGNDAAAVTFGDGGWTVVGEGYTASGETLYNGAGPAWQQDNDGVLGFDHNVSLVRTFAPEDLIPEKDCDDRSTLADKSVGFTMWNDAANKAGVTVTFSYGGQSYSKVIAAGDKPSFEWRIPRGLSGDKLTVTITPNEGASATNPCRVAAVRLASSVLPLVNPEGDILYLPDWKADQMGFDRDDERFYNLGWQACDEEGDELSYEDRFALDGSVAWARDVDGVIAHEAGSTIARTFDVEADAAYLAKTWNAEPGMKVAFYAGEAAEGEPLATFDTGDYAANWWAEGPVVSVPADQTKLTVTLTGTAAGNKIAALQLTSLGSASRLGSYDATVAKYADGSKGLDDATSCMDYVYCVLNHLFDDTALSYKGLALKAPVSGLYNSIVLSSDATTEGGYSFVADTLHSAQKSGILEPDAAEPDDGYKDLKYDLAAGTIENVAAGAGVDRAGFFPLDELEGGQIFDAQYEYAVNEGERVEKAEAMGSHNYHYSMVSRSKFIYDASKDQYFAFEGDDDTYLYINNQLVIDLGGAHLAQQQTVALEDESPEAGKTWAQYLGLVDGQTYNFDFFYLERHTDNSDFAVTTNIDLRSRSAADDDDPSGPSDPGNKPGADDGENKGNEQNGGQGGVQKASAKKGKGGALPQTGDANAVATITVAGAGVAFLALFVISRARARR